MEYDETIKRSLKREYFKILAYSNIVKKIVVDAYDNFAEGEVYGIYDFENGVLHQVGTRMYMFRFCGDSNWWDNKREASFGYFIMHTEHVNSHGEYDACSRNAALCLLD